jgi:hypothetical protein
MMKPALLGFALDTRVKPVMVTVLLGFIVLLLSDDG